MTSSRIKGFYRLPVEERIRLLETRGFLSAEDAVALGAGKPLLSLPIADRMIENVVGVFGLPFSIAPNFQVNGKDYIVPMVVEEPSIVAGVSGAANTIRECGGFVAS